MKAFIETNFRAIDINTDGVIGIEEYRYDCIQRMVVEDIKEIDDAFNSLLTVSEIVYYFFYFYKDVDRDNFRAIDINTDGGIGIEE